VRSAMRSVEISMICMNSTTPHPPRQKVAHNAAYGVILRVPIGSLNRVFPSA
jgi:hypothetical protein